MVLGEAAPLAEGFHRKEQDYEPSATQQSLQLREYVLWFSSGGGGAWDLGAASDIHHLHLSPPLEIPLIVGGVTRPSSQRDLSLWSQSLPRLWNSCTCPFHIKTVYKGVTQYVIKHICISPLPPTHIFFLHQDPDKYIYLLYTHTHICVYIYIHFQEKIFIYTFEP